MVEAYRKRLLQVINSLYTKEQVDSIEWYNDIDKIETYTFVYNDHKGKHCRLMLEKESGRVQLYQ